MSQENVEIVRRVSDAYNRRDAGAMIDELHPEIEWHPWLQLSAGGGPPCPGGTKASAGAIREEEEPPKIQAEHTRSEDLGEASRRHRSRTGGRGGGERRQ